jgi:hypothetical protein
VTLLPRWHPQGLRQRAGNRAVACPLQGLRATECRSWRPRSASPPVVQSRDRKRRQQTGARGDGRTRVDVVALAAGQRLVRVVPRACRRNGRADQENHDCRPGSQAARRLVALREGWRHSRRSKDESGVRPAFISLAKRGRWLAVAAETRGHIQGADVKIGPAARNSSSRMLGSWLGIAGSHRIRGWQGARPVS